MSPIETEVTPELVNITLPRSVTLSGMTIDVNPVQNSKARSPMVVTEVGMVKAVRPVQLPKA